MYKKIILLVVILTAITISILGIYYGVVQNKERMEERKEVFNTIYIHIDLNAQKVKKMLKDFPIYYINLDRVKDRRDFMEKQIKKYGVKMTRISAVDALDLDWKSGMANDIPYKNYYKKNKAPRIESYNIAELACTLSHLYTIKQSYDNGDEIALILEDDVDIGLAALWEKSLKELIKSVPKGWDCINLFSFNIDREKYNIFVPLELGKNWGCAAYILNRKGMEKVLKVYNNNKFILQGPKYLVADYFIYSLVVNVYTYTKKFLFILSDFASNIQGGNVKNYTVLGQTLIDDMEEYVINYLNEFPIYGGMATIPMRAKNLHLVINSIKGQIDHLYVHANYNEEKIPECLNAPWITVTLSKDYGDMGDAGKFFGLCNNEFGRNCFSLTFDDDLVYPSNYVKKMISSSKTYNHSALITYHGGILPSTVRSFKNQRNDIYFNNNNNRDKTLNILGTGVTLYPPNLINLKMTDFKRPNSADLFVSMVAQKQKIPIIGIKHKANTIKEIKYKNNLWNVEKKNKNLALANTKLARTIKWKLYHPLFKNN